MEPSHASHAPDAPDDLLRHAGFLRALAGGLVGADGAEDVVQDAWLAALRRPPERGAERGAVRGWLAHVTRQLASNARRGSGRRAERERRAARPEALGPPEEMLERLETSRALSNHVLELSDPQRTAIFLRYYEGLTPQRIAERLGVPIKTVKTRLHRALTELRERLDADHAGSRERWLGALLPLALDGRGLEAIPLAGAGTGSLIGATLMGKKLMLGVVVSVLAALVWIGASDPFARSVTPEPGTAVAPATLAAPAEEALAEELRSAAPVEDVARAEVAAPRVAVETGALVVHLRDADGAPAADLAIDARCDGDPAPREEHFTARTDPSGVARFEALFPGRVRLTLDRGPRFQGTVVAGAESELELTIPPGVVVDGRVLDDDDQPVAGAGIWIEARRDRPHVVARTRPDGGFRVEGLTGDGSIGAVAAGYTASHDMSLDWLAAETDGTRRVTLRMVRGGGTVVGRVLGPDGRPVPGARVRVGSGQRAQTGLPDGSPALRPRALPVQTGADGGFATTGSLPPGPAPVVVTARGWPAWEGEVEVPAGGTNRIDVVLEHGATIVGRVVDRSGAAVAGAEVLAAEGSRWEEPAPPPRAHTDTDGRFTLRWIAPGEQRISVAAEPWELGMAEMRVTCVAGGTQEVVLRLDPSPAIEGRVTDGEGRPLARWQVWAETRPGDIANHRLGRTDERGGFLLPNLDAAAVYRVCVGAPDERPLRPRATSDGVRAGGRPVEVVVSDVVAADAGVRGRLLDGAGAVPSGVEVVLWPAGINSGLTLEHDAETGAFERGALLAGTYRLTVHDPSRTLLETEVFEIERGVTHDVGELRLAARGRVELELHGAGDGNMLEWPTLTGLDLVAREVLHPDGDRFRSEEVPAGRWLLRVRPAHGFVADREVEIRPGEPTRLELEVHPAVAAAVGLLRDDPGRPWPRLRATVEGAAGEALQIDVPSSAPEEVKPGYLLRLLLPVGEHSVVVWTDDGRRAEGVLVVPAEGGGPPLELHLR